MAQRELKYQKIIDWVKESIADGTLKSGDRMPSEYELVQRFNTSRQTVRHATGELEKEGIVARMQGSGTYIGSAPRTGRGTPRNNIAVVSTFYESYIFPPTLKGIESVLSREGYTTQIAFTDNRLQREREILESLLEKDEIDGLIVEPAKSSLPNPNLAYYRKILEKQIPVICFNAAYPDLDIPCVRIDDRQIASDAARLLIRAGHTKIAGIFKADDGQGKLRYAGYIDAMLEQKLPIEQDHVLWIDTPATLHLADLADYILSRIGGATGIVAYNDQVAYQLIEIFIQKGIKVPEQVSVVGIDDSYLATMGRVPFTSFPHPKEKLGERVGENLIEMIRKPVYNGNCLFQAMPVMRQSVWDLNKGQLYM